MPPRLVVQITLDQFWGELVPRMEPMFTGGFRRVLDGGFYYEQGRVAHGLTASHPGHATLATGSHPATHGLVANEIWVPTGDGHWSWKEIVADDGEHILGYPDRIGPSPRAESVPTLGTWMKQDRAGRRSVTISNSNFAAASQAGWAADGAYWLDGETGRMVTSSYYTSAYPDWVDAFNDGPMAEYRAIDTWDVAVPEAYRDLARPDSATYEADGGASSVFPHRLDLGPSSGATETALRGAFLRGTPISDQAILRFATEAVRNERLGTRGETDYLNVGLGSTDNVGHTYGPRSLEQLDTMYRLDRYLGVFFATLDSLVGEGRWVVAITGDHGVAEVLESRMERGLPARRVTTSEIDALLDDIEAIAKAHPGPDSALVPLIERRLEEADFVADALTQDELMGRDETDFPYIDAMRLSFRPGMTPDFPLWGTGRRDYHPARYGIWVVFREYTSFDNAASVHASPYPYDRWVPVMFYGAGVTAGRSSREARTVDIAPTLSRLAGVVIPATVDGAVLEEVVN